MTKLAQILKDFSPISLEEMKSVKFMNRVDTKYLFSVSKLPDLLLNITNDYQVLEIDNHREFSYNTIYFDTPDYLFFKQHVTGKLGRNKVRIRTYETNSLAYLEVKYKSNKGRTTKTRIRREAGKAYDDKEAQCFLKERISADTKSLRAVLTSRFRRITLADLSACERITIDYNLLYTNNDGNSIELPFLAIAEVKSDKSTSHSHFVQQLKKLGIHQTRFSKYCTGVALLNDLPRKNNVKPKLLMINKIKDEYTKYGVA